MTSNEPHTLIEWYSYTGDYSLQPFSCDLIFFLTFPQCPDNHVCSRHWCTLLYKNKQMRYSVLSYLDITTQKICFLEREVKHILDGEKKKKKTLREDAGQ